MCGKKWWTVALAAIVIVFALWETAYSMWIVVVAAAAILIIALMQKSEMGMAPSSSMDMKAKPKKK